MSSSVKFIYYDKTDTIFRVKATRVTYILQGDRLLEKYPNVWTFATNEWILPIKYFNQVSHFLKQENKNVQWREQYFSKYMNVKYTRGRFFKKIKEPFEFRRELYDINRATNFPSYDFKILDQKKRKTEINPVLKKSPSSRSPHPISLTPQPTSETTPHVSPTIVPPVLTTNVSVKPVVKPTVSVPNPIVNQTQSPTITKYVRQMPSPRQSPVYTSPKITETEIDRINFFEQQKREYEESTQSTRNPVDYYKIFSKKNQSFKKMIDNRQIRRYNSDPESESDSSSDSDSILYPASPKPVVTITRELFRKLVLKVQKLSRDVAMIKTKLL